MRAIQISILAGATMIVFAGFAQAQSTGTHVLTIHLPDGIGRAPLWSMLKAANRLMPHVGVR